MQRYSLIRLALKQFGLLFGSVWFVTGLGIAIGGAVLFWSNHRYASEGVAVDARVQELTTSKGNKGSTIYHVEYTFQTPDGGQFSNESQIDKDYWQSMSKGSAVKVEYLRSSPSDNRIVQESDQVLPFVLLGIGSLLGLPGLVLTVRGALRVWHNLNVIRSGELAVAAVTAVTESGMRVNGVRQWYVFYRYTDYSGKEHEGRSDYLPPAEAGQWKPGDKGRLRFDRENPAWSYWMGRDE